MNAPRVSDEQVDEFIEILEAFGVQENFEKFLLLKALLDLKDARDQLERHQALRRMHTKEPE